MLLPFLSPLAFWFHLFMLKMLVLCDIARIYFHCLLWTKAILKLYFIFAITSAMFTSKFCLLFFGEYLFYILERSHRQIIFLCHCSQNIHFIHNHHILLPKDRKDGQNLNWLHPKSQLHNNNIIRHRNITTVIFTI